MKPAPFVYHCPETLREALQLTAEHGEAACILAGGQSLMPLINARRLRPRHLIDLNMLRDLDHIEITDTTLVIGALVRQARTLASSDVATFAPLVAESVKHIASPTIRNRGTICGSVAFAHPAGEMPAAALAMGGEVVAHHADGERRIDLQSFFVKPFVTALRPSEVITELRLARWTPAAGHAFLEVGRMRWPVVSAAALVELDGDVVSRCAVAIAGVGETPARETAVEQALTGVVPTEAAVSTAAVAVSVDRGLYHDIHGTAAYRLQVARVLARRTLSQAAERAGELRV